MTVKCPECGNRTEVVIEREAEGEDTDSVIEVVTADFELWCPDCQTQWEERFVLR